MITLYNVAAVLVINLFFAICAYDVTREPEELLALHGPMKDLPGPLFLLMNLGIAQLILNSGCFHLPLLLFFSLIYFTGTFLILVVYGPKFLRWAFAGFILWLAARLFAADNGNAALIWYNTGMLLTSLLTFLPMVCLVVHCIIEVSREDQDSN